MIILILRELFGIFAANIRDCRMLITLQTALQDTRLERVSDGEASSPNLSRRIGLCGSLLSAEVFLLLCQMG